MRGDLVVAALPKDHGKPRPVLIIQADSFAERPMVTVLPLTSTLQDAPLFRLTVEPSPGNGLKARSQIMVDRAATLSRDEVGQPIGRVDDRTMVAVNRALAVFLGIA
jgi:mRNA interferase MazF